MNRLRKPDRIQVITEIPEQAQEVQVNLQIESDLLQAKLVAGEIPVKEVILCWEKEAKEAGKILGDHWERGYGDLEWKNPEEAKVIPWYFFDKRENACRAYGVKVRPGAMCWWSIEGEDVLLHLDVRAGGSGVILGERELLMAEILMDEYQDMDRFSAARKFAYRMCNDAIMPEKPVYGANNWYYAYGKSSREEILKDSEYLAAMTEGIENRPFMVIDDGWQEAHAPGYNGGPWTAGNKDYGDMKKLAEDMKACGIRPGIWCRLLWERSEEIPEDWRYKHSREFLDVSNPEVIRHVQEDIHRISGWGYELIKHDFSTFDIFGRWGFQMGSEITDDGWSFQDRSRTSAEWIVNFYRAIKEAAGDTLILGCNCIGHLGAGYMELNRTGDDTSGLEWERTKKMGVNTLAFRAPHHEAFYAADADCVGITDAVPWEKNRQWLEVLSCSGTPLFVSVRPGTLNPEQEEELRAAYKKAAVNTVVAVPLDWEETKTPEKWLTFEGERVFEW